MPSKKKPALELLTIPQELIDQFVTDPTGAQAVQAASMTFKKTLIERALAAEMSNCATPPERAGPRRREQAP